MSIKVKYRDLLLSVEALRSVASMRAPASVALRMAKALRKVEEALADLDRARQLVVERYMRNGEIPEDLMPAAESEIRDLLETEVEIEARITKEDLEKLEGGLVIRDMMALSWMWEDEKSEGMKGGSG